MLLFSSVHCYKILYNNAETALLIAFEKEHSEIPNFFFFCQKKYRTKISFFLNFKTVQKVPDFHFRVSVPVKKRSISDMKRLCCDVVDNFFPSVYLAMDEADVDITPGSENAILVWHDSIHTRGYFRKLQCWQVVNRVPMIDTICHKAFFIHGVQRLEKLFPGAYHFVPKSYILPILDSYFQCKLKKSNKTFIIKPDNGSFGRGIEILTPGDVYKTPKFLAIAQEYIESYLIDNTKFDLRVYVLLASVEPLEVYVYRDGVARFCSAKSDCDSKFSMLTNVELNKENPDVEIKEISKLISDVFNGMKEKGIDTDEIWSKIDEAVVLCIISCYGQLQKGIQQNCPRMGYYSRCFQLLGFDILLDKNLKPWVLEVNYRPSLKFYTAPERRMKVNLLKDVIKIGCPLQNLQSVFIARKQEWCDSSFFSFINHEPGLMNAIEKSREKAYSKSKFVRAHPSNRPQQRIWNEILKKQISLPEENILELSMPLIQTISGSNTT